MGLYQSGSGDDTCWNHGGFWGSVVVTCPGYDVTVAMSWNQAAPEPPVDIDSWLGAIVSAALEA